MPLVVPGLTASSSQPSLSEWQNKLMGKKIGDSHSASTFDKTELPSKHRILEPGSMSTTDHVPDRYRPSSGLLLDLEHDEMSLNVYVNEDKTVYDVKFA